MPAVPYGSAGLDPTATITIEITNGTDTATDTITLDPLTGYTQLVATTQATLSKGDWGYSGADGWDNPVPAGSVLWYDVPTGATLGADGSLTVDGAFTGGTGVYIVWDSGDRNVYQLTLTYDGEGVVVEITVSRNTNKQTRIAAHSMPAMITPMF